ncbi:MAG: hypothetical protein ACOH2F_05995 [Cellulomonas sp.]
MPPGPLRAGGWLVPLVGVVAFIARLWPVMIAGTLRGVQGYDDGVHLAVAQRLIAGVLPYRDEVFLHPPGIAVALSPIAAMAGMWGDSWSLVLARLLFMGVGAVNAMLIARILRPRGTLAALVGGGAYALGGFTVTAEHTVFLETAINLGLLVALAALARAGVGTPARSPRVTRALAVSGLALGLAATFKIWVAIDVVVLGALILARWGLPAVGRWLGWCLAGAVPVLLPFFVASPGRMWFDVLSAQSGRPLQAKGLLERLGAVGVASDLHLGWVGLVAALIAVPLLAATVAPVLVMLSRRVGPARWPDPVWWGMLAGLQMTAIAVAPSFYSHYLSFVAPALCLMLGAGVGHLVTAARERGGRTARAGVTLIAAVGIAVGGVLVAVTPALPTSGRVDNAALAEFAAGHDCLWVRNPSYLQVADATTRQIARRCPATMDLVGAWLVFTAGGTVPGSQASTLDDLVLAQLAGSDGALLAAGHPTQGLGSRSQAYLVAHFARTGRTGQIEMWTRTT